MLNFEWMHGTGETHKSLKNLINYNGGAWKSEKQANFFIKYHACNRSKENLKVCFGIDIEESEALVIETEAHMQNASYGARGIVPFTTFFIVDNSGIVAEYRLRYKGNMRDGCAPNPEKTECKWRR